MSRVVRESTPLGNQRVKVHPTELAPRDCGRFHPDWCGHVNRAGEVGVWVERLEVLGGCVVT